MEQAKRELVQSWFAKAKEDLGAARKLASDPDPFLATAIYHCQQAAEKAVKGLLVYHDVEVEKVHNIATLIRAASVSEPSIAIWETVGAGLTPYASRFRYPGTVQKPSRQEFDQALQDAEQLCNFVLSLLPADVYP